MKLMRKALAILTLCMLGANAVALEPNTHFGSVAIGDRIELHYAEAGVGEPVVFVHGSLSDMSYWKGEVEAFAPHWHAIAYSRRYNFPNHNPAVAGYSAVTDAQDLAAFIKNLHLGKVYLVGHSYGALTALFLAVHHPELIRAMVLAEPPAISLLQDVQGKDRPQALAMYADIQQRMVTPMQRDFGAGRREAGVADFIDYVLADPDAWHKKFTAGDRAQTMRDAHEWDVMLTTGTLFPAVSANQIAGIRVPVLIMSGAKSYPFLPVIDDYLATHIAHAQSVIYPDAGHQMWYQDAAQARTATQAFFAKHP